MAGLVTRLDGMPLAIELAAARVEALGVAQLLDRVDDRFALLAEGDRLAPSRQRSLAATVEWSYQLLAENERRVFRLLSLFPGPFTLQAAEDVAGPVPARPCCILWTARCWSRPGPGPTAAPVRDARDAACTRDRAAGHSRRARLGRYHTGQIRRDGGRAGRGGAADR